MRFFKLFKTFVQSEYRSRIVAIVVLTLLSLSILTAYQNCGGVRFSTIDTETPPPTCPTPPCTSSCNFSGAVINTDPTSGYQLNQSIRFSVSSSFYTSITWKFYRDANNDGNPESNELIPGTPTGPTPQITFSQSSNYIAVADLSKNVNPSQPTAVCETTLTKFIPLQLNPPCDPLGINGPDVAFVGDVQTFSLAKPACFNGTVSWDLDRPRGGAATANEFTTVNANDPVSFTYTSAHARSNGGLYTVRAAVTGAGHNYDFSKDIDVRFKSCFHGGREIPGDGPLSVFNAYTTNAGTCAVACSAQQFRCENGAIVPVDGVSQILNYPFATCANPTPGSCSGSGAACGSVGSFYVKPANTSLCTSGSVSSFSPGAQPTGTPINSAPATWNCNGATSSVNCSGIWCHQQQTLVNGVCTTPTTLAPAPTMAGCFVDTIAWDVPTLNGCEGYGCTNTDKITFSVGTRLAAASPLGNPGDNYIFDDYTKYTFNWTLRRSSTTGTIIPCLYGSQTPSCTPNSVTNGRYYATVVVRRIADGQTWTFANMLAVKNVRHTNSQGQCSIEP